MKRWIKLDREAIDDGCDGLLFDIAERADKPFAIVLSIWVAMLCRADKADPVGSLHGWRDRKIAQLLEVPIEDVTAVREAMQGIMLDGLEVIGFAEDHARARDAERKAERKVSDQGGSKPAKSLQVHDNPAKSGAVQTIPKNSGQVYEFPGLSGEVQKTPLEENRGEERRGEENSSSPNGDSHTPAGAGGKSVPKGSGKAGTGYPQAFEQFWKAYPRRVEKKGAFAKWEVAVKQLTAELGDKDEAKRRLIDTAASYAKGCSKLEPRFIKHPTTWLNNGCWDDEGSPAPSSTYWGGAPVPLNDPTIRHDGSAITGTGRG